MVWEYYLVLTCLAIGTYFDVFNKRMIPNIIWTLGLIVGIIGFIITGYTILFIKIVELAGIFLLAYFITRIGFMGGADAQALVFMTFLLPVGDSLFIMNNSFLVAGLLMPFYFIYNKISFRNWGNFPMPFILFMYLGTLTHLVIGNWFLKILVV
jgi:Flp pilus assembly protein protease CpaA